MAATNTTAKKPAKSTSAKKTAEKIAQTTEQKLVQLLADTPVQIFPYSRLSHTGLNTRIIPHTDQEVEEMADSIQAMGILQNLIGAELPDGTIGIVGGEGRRRGTGILVMRGVLDADTPFVPVKVLPAELAVAASMIENGRRKNLHPAEQIIGFRTLAQEGKTASQISALMGYPPRHVQRCLKLANLAPSLLDALARDDITLEHCEVMTLADSHERQLQIWEEAKAQWGGRIPEPPTLRKMVTDDKMAISHPMFAFVGEDAYTAAGGILTADLFSDRDSTFADAVQVKSLLAGKLTVLAARLKQEQGWGWAEFRMTELPDTHVVEFVAVDTRFNDCCNWQVMNGEERVLFSTRMHEQFRDVKSGLMATVEVCEGHPEPSDKRMLAAAKSMLSLLDKYPSFASLAAHPGRIDN